MGKTMMTAEANKELVRRYHFELWRDGDMGAIDRYWHPEARVHMTDWDGNAVDTVRADVERYFGAFSDVETEIRDLVAEGNKVVLHWQTAGTHVGPYGEIGATGKRITMTGMDLLTLEEGRIVTCWSMWDGLSVYEQLDALTIGVKEA